MKGVFIYYKKIDFDCLTGIDKKVLWQVDAFRKSGLKCEIVTMDDERKNLIGTIYNMLMCRLPFGNSYPKWKYVNEFNNIDFLYLRRPNAFSVHMISTLQQIKKANPNIKIILEIPTYPYEEELKLHWYNYPMFIKDKYNRKRLAKNISRIAVQNDVDEIFGIPTLKFVNGIKIEDIDIRTPCEDDKGIINICAIASLEPWQGYERAIKGLNTYYQDGGTRNIIIHLVGNGSERKYYEELVKESKLDKHVKFYGILTGQKLSNIYNVSDLALDAFGRYKTHNDISTSLKSREYLAKGLPIISGCKADILNKNFPYYLEYPSDCSEVDFNHIVIFHDKIYKSKETKLEVTEKIRKYAFQVCDISNTMKNIINYMTMS